MARINIEEKWFSGEPRRDLLINKIGNRYIVDGIFLNMIRTAQLSLESNFVIAEKVFQSFPHWEDFFECGLAEKAESGYVLDGSQKHLSWLKELKEKSKDGGKKSAQRPRDEKGRLLPRVVQAESKPRLDFVQGSSKGDPRSSKPLSLSLSQENTNIHTNAPTLNPDDISKAWGVWNDTLESFGIRRTNIAPPQEASIARAIKTLGLENVLLALEGARYEKSSDDFKPQEHLSVDRALHKDRFGKSNWERFKNFALSNQAKPKNTGRRIIKDFTKEYPTNE